MDMNELEKQLEGLGIAPSDKDEEFNPAKTADRHKDVSVDQLAALTVLDTLIYENFTKEQIARVRANMEAKRAAKKDDDS